MGGSGLDPSAHAWESQSDSADGGGVWPGWRTTAVSALTSVPHLPSHALLPSTVCAVALTLPQSPSCPPHQLIWVMVKHVLLKGPSGPPPAHLTKWPATHFHHNTHLILCGWSVHYPAPPSILKSHSGKILSVFFIF